MDIVTAYKSLKNALNKPSTIDTLNTKNKNKGYLKMTIAAAQHSKANMSNHILEYSLANSTINYLTNLRRKNSVDCF